MTHLKIMLAVVTLLAVATSFGQSSAPPHIQWTDCSSSGHTSITYGMVQNVRPGNQKAHTFNFQSLLPKCSAGYFDDAVVLMYGWKWSQARRTTTICDLEVDLITNSYNSVSGVVEWSVRVGANTSSLCNDEDRAEFEVHFGILRTIQGTVDIKPSSSFLKVQQSCSVTGSIGCDASTTAVDAVPAPNQFAGMALTGFKLESLVPGGTLVGQIGVGASGVRLSSGKDVHWVSSCQLGDPLAPAGLNCDVRAAALSLSLPEIEGIYASRLFMSNGTHSTPFIHSFALPLTGGRTPSLCALNRFSLSFANGAHPVWNVQAGAHALDCNTTPTAGHPSWTGFLFPNLGSIHPGAGLPTPWLTLPFMYHMELNGLHLK